MLEGRIGDGKCEKRDLAISAVKSLWGFCKVDYLRHRVSRGGLGVHPIIKLFGRPALADDTEGHGIFSRKFELL